MHDPQHPAHLHHEVDSATLNRVVARNPELAIPVGGDETRKYSATAGQTLRDYQRQKEWQSGGIKVVWPDVPVNRW